MKRSISYTRFSVQDQTFLGHRRGGGGGGGGGGAGSKTKTLQLAVVLALTMKQFSMHLMHLSMVTATPPPPPPPPPPNSGHMGDLIFIKSNAQLLGTNNWSNDPSSTKSRYMFDTFYNLRFRSCYSKRTRVSLCGYTAAIVPL